MGSSKFIAIPELSAKSIQRFWKHVDSGSADGCWLWIGCLNRQGYGKLTINGRNFRAPRVSLHIAGRSPGDALVCHSCDTPACVRPDHLFLDDHRGNALDALAKGRLVTGDRHHGRHFPNKMPRGEVHPCAKITEATVKAIREKSFAGQSVAILAKEFKLQRGHVNKIVKRLSWKHIP